MKFLLSIETYAFDFAIYFKLTSQFRLRCIVILQKCIYKVSMALLTNDIDEYLQVEQ